MRALCIQQPYAEDIMAGAKPIEYRSWMTHYRGELLICASKVPKVKGLPGGVAVGIVDLVDITGEPGEYDWHLANPRRLAKPFNAHGNCGLLNIDLPAGAQFGPPQPQVSEDEFRASDPHGEAGDSGQPPADNGPVVVLDDKEFWRDWQYGRE